MPVPTAISALAVLAGDNPPDGGVETPVTMDNHLRQVYSFLAQLNRGRALTSISGTNNLTATAALTNSAYVSGDIYYGIAVNANTGNLNLNINGLGSVDVLQGESELTPGTFQPGSAFSVMYDGSDFQLLTVSSWVKEIISEDYEIDVPADFDTLDDAFDSLDGKLIATSATVTIQIADGTYDHSTSGTIQLNHPSGERIRIIGNQTTPGDCILDFGDATYNGITVTRGHVLGFLDGVHVRHNSQKLVTHGDNWDSTSTGILANDAAMIFCGENIVVSDFFYGIAAKQNSHVECKYAKVYKAGDVGIWCYHGSFIDCSNSEVHTCANDDTGFGSGVTAEYNSAIMATGIISHDNNFNGLTCRSNSVIRAKLGELYNNGRSGAFTSVNGLIQIGGTNIYGNTDWGIEPTENSYIAETSEATFVGAANGLGNIKNNVISSPRIDGSAQLITSEDGPLYIQASGGNGIYFHTATDQRQFIVEHQAGATNAVAVRAGLTGGPAWIYPVGQTNADLKLSGAGTGSVRIGPYAGSADAPVVGYIEVMDHAGNVRKLAVIA